MAKISVVIAVYNGEDYIKDCLYSVKEQKFNDFEIIVVDDCSSDATKCILEELNSSFDFINIRLDINVGAARARNIGIEKSSSDLIAILDADDKMLPERLELQYDFMLSNPDYVVVGGNALFVDMNGKYIFQTEQKVSNEEIRSVLPDSPFIHPSIMFRKNEFLLCGGYPTYMRRSQDTVMLNRLLTYGKGANLTKPVIIYRLTPGSNSLRNRIERKRFKSIIENAIEFDYISQEDDNFVRDSMINNQSVNKLFNYYLLLSKKYLWNSYDFKMARINALKALRIRTNYEVIFVLALSFLPKSGVRFLYTFLKNIE